MAESTTMQLIIYIDEKLMVPDKNTGLPRIGNLALVRKVSGVANVIFQSKTTTEFSVKNTFEWGQSYKISASSTPPQPSVFVSAETPQRPISAGFMCDWQPDASKPPLQYMPEAQPTDAGFNSQYPASQEMFGTKNEPDKWYNQVWCSTSGGKFNCIYTDATTLPGVNYRGYQVQNTYQVSWEAKNYGLGVFAASWTVPYVFNISSSQNIKYLSWGYASTGNTTWFDYGATDPGSHDPSKATPSGPMLSAVAPFGLVSASSGTVSVSPGTISPFPPINIGFRLDWTGPSYSSETRKKYADAIYQYISQSTNGWLNISDVYIGLYISGRASLRWGTSFGDWIPGETEAEKIRYYLRGVVACISPRFAPNLTDWNYSRAYQISTTSLGGLSAFFQLVWSKLTGPVISLATTSLNYLKPLIGNAVQSAFAGVTIEYENVQSIGENSASVKLKVLNYPAGQLSQVFQLVNNIATQERNNPQAIQPDPVSAQNNGASFDAYEEIPSESRMIEAAPPANSGASLPGQEAEYQQPLPIANHAAGNPYQQSQNTNQYQDGYGQGQGSGLGNQSLSYRPSAAVGA